MCWKPMQTSIMVLHVGVATGGHMFGTSPLAAGTDQLTDLPGTRADTHADTPSWRFMLLLQAHCRLHLRPLQLGGDC